MKKRKTTAVCLALCLLLGLPACAHPQQAAHPDEGPKTTPSSQTQPESQPPPSSGGELSSQKLTVLTTYQHEYAGLTPWAKDFMRLHPDVEIEMEYGVEALASDEQWDHYRTRWTTELMSGEAADVLLDEGYVNPAQYEQSGLMVDLYQWMDQDPDFQDTDYFHNLFEAFEINGHLYTLPVTYFFEIVYLNDALLQASGLELAQWDKINYKQILEIYQSAAAQGLLAEGFTLEYQDMKPVSLLFLDTEMVDYVNLEDRSAAFDSPEFVEYLSETKKIPSRRKASDGQVLVGGQAQLMMEEFAKSNAEGHTSLMMDLNISLDGRIDNMDQLVEGCAGPFILASSQGTQSFYPEMKVAVPASCQNPELAWEFLKFMIAPAGIPAYGQRWNPEGSVDLSKTFVPVGRENFRTFAKLYSQGANHVKETHGEAWPADFDLTTAPCPVTDQLLDKLETVIEGITKTKDRFGPLEELLQPVLEEYYNTDTQTAQQCAQRLQEIADIYLNE